MTLTADLNENNLDLLRLIFAGIVVLFHTSALTGLPALAVLGEYCNPHFAVRGFFVISGLLIYRSYERSSSVRSYLEKRARRIYPAYFTIVAVAAVVLPFLSPDFPFRTYGVAFWKYLGANLVFLNFLAPNLPGVFSANPERAVNGALWTLKIEVVFYLCVPVIFALCRRFGARTTIGAIFGLSCLWKYIFWRLSVLDPARSIWYKLDVQIPSQMAYFCAGILLLIYMAKVRDHALFVSVIAAGAFVLDHLWRTEALDVVFIAGFVLVCGFGRYLGNFAKYGDFSYGVYIVHWPILQCMILFKLTSLNPYMFLSLDLVFVFVASFLMWHLVEKRFLQVSSHYRRAPVEARNAVGVPV